MVHLFYVYVYQLIVRIAPDDVSDVCTVLCLPDAYYPYTYTVIELYKASSGEGTLSI